MEGSHPGVFRTDAEESFPSCGRRCVVWMTSASLCSETMGGVVVVVRSEMRGVEGFRSVARCVGEGGPPSLRDQKCEVGRFRCVVPK